MPISERTLTCVLVAPKHAGKTVFAAALASLPYISLNDPKSIKILKEHWRALLAGEVPAATEAVFNELRFTYRGEILDEKVRLDFSMPDYDGHFAEILSDYEAGEKGLADLRSIFERAAGFIIFLPADEADAANVGAVRMELGHLIKLASLYTQGYEKIRAPVVLLVNKWDRSPWFKSPDEDKRAEEFIDSIPVYKQIRDNLNEFFADCRVVAASSFGHVADNDIPKPGAMNPYRAFEPIRIITEEFFKNQDAELASADPLDYSRKALETRSIWQKRPGADARAQKLTASLNALRERLREKLASAKNAAEYERVFNGAPESELAEYFPDKEFLRKERERALNASFGELLSGLEKAKTAAEYDSILREAPEFPFAREFSAEQKSRLENLKNSLKRQDARRKRKKYAKYAVPVFLVLFALIALWRWTAFLSAYDDAINADGSPSEKRAAIASFLAAYSKNPAIAFLGEGKLRDARAELAFVDADAEKQIGAELDKLGKNSDFCARQRAAEFLLARSRQAGAYPSPALALRLEAATASAGALCDAAKTINSAAVQSDLASAETILAALPSGADKDALIALADAKKNEIRVLEWKTREENARRTAEETRNAAAEAYAALEIESDPLKKYDALKDFLARFGSRPDCETWTKSAREALPAARYAAMVKTLSDLDEPAGEEFARLRALAAEVGDSLSTREKETLAEKMRPLAEERDRRLLSGINAKISGADELEDAEKDLAEAKRTGAALRLESGIFAYVRSADLAEELAAKEAALKNYRRILRDGISTRDFEIIAASGNALGVGARRLASAFTDAYELDASLPGGLGSFSWRDKDFKKREEGDRYVLSYGPVKLRAVSGKVVLRAPGLVGENRCETNLKITAADLFRLENSGVLEIPAGGACGGVVFRFLK